MGQGLRPPSRDVFEGPPKTPLPCVPAPAPKASDSFGVRLACPAGTEAAVAGSIPVPTLVCNPGHTGPPSRLRVKVGGS